VVRLRREDLLLHRQAGAERYPANAGKQVFQFNYRWQALRNPIPDRFCIDELVQIADGLYLGQVFYSMDWLVPWNPSTEIANTSTASSSTSSSWMRNGMPGG